MNNRKNNLFIILAGIFITNAVLAEIIGVKIFSLEINKTINGNPFNIEDAYDRIFSQSMGIIFGSLVAFLVSQFLDVHVFRYLRKITGSKYIWLRATGSTLVSQLIDSFIVLVIAFRLFAGEYA